MSRQDTGSRMPVLILLLVNLVLGGLIALEIRQPELFVRRAAILVDAIPPSDSGATPATTRLQPITIGEAAFAAIATRPLFSPDRRPSEDAADSSTGPVSADLSAYAVTGVVTSADGGVAILEKSGGAPGPGLVLSPGDTIEGWTLDEILDDRVVVVKDGERQELMLRKDEARPRARTRRAQPGTQQPAQTPRRILPRAPEVQQQQQQLQQQQQQQPSQ